MQAQVTGPPPRKLAPITTRTFGRFRLERRLAYGGMAEIVLATDLRNSRQCVLKRILPQYSSNPEFVQYFIHEGRLGQRLVHDNLVETYEAGQVGETCYIALEYLRGNTCIELLRAAAKAGLELPLGAAVRIVADAARGLHHAHVATDATGQPLGVVHRDVTPHNLFLCRDGRTKVLDFGIAKAASQLHVTRTGTIKGKFSYLAPEQIRGETIDHRVDVFALGIVLHELLTLRPLFRGGNDADTLQRILTLEVPPPERVRHAVPPGLGAVALRALMRDRERRLPSAEALADSIEAVAEAECIDASEEVVAGLLAELCPPPPEEAPAPADLDFGPEPPSVRSRSKSKSGLIAGALGATASVSMKDRPSAPLPLPLPPPPLPLNRDKPQLLILGDGNLDLDELDSGPIELLPSPSAVLATPLQDSQSAPLPIPVMQIQLNDTVPNRAAILPSLELEPEIEVTPSEPVSLGLGSGATPTLPELPRGRIARLAAVVVALAVMVVGLLLLFRTRPVPQVPAAPLEQAAPAPVQVQAPQPPPRAEPPPSLPAAEPRLAQEGFVRLQTDGPVSLTVDGRAVHAAADGLFHLPPGHHKLSVQGPLLAGPRSFELDLKNGETLTRAVRSGRGRLRVAVTPWAEVLVDGRSVGTTPIAPLELKEGTHNLVLKNGDLGANVAKRVVVIPDKETVLRVDLFGR